jgi:hypothetical protein
MIRMELEQPGTMLTYEDRNPSPDAENLRPHLPPR